LDNDAKNGVRDGSDYEIRGDSMWF
jgi:hypothetical protein